MKKESLEKMSKVKKIKKITFKKWDYVNSMNLKQQE